VATCRAHRVPLVSRGGGTSLSGQTTGSGVVVDWSRHCHRLLSVDPEARRAVVEPGIVLDELDRQLRPHGLMYGPRPAPHWTCTLGGMIGNNSCGATAQTYGKTVDNVHRLEVLLADGTRMWVGPTSDQEYAEIVGAGGRRAEVYRGLRRLRDEHLAAIRTGYPHIPRRVSGYGLDSLLPEAGFDVARALVGSEGTLVTVLRAELALVPLPRHTALVALAYRDVVTAARAVPAINAEQPHRLEGWDRLMVDLERQQGVHTDALGLLPDGGGWLLVEVVGDSDEEAEQAAHRVVQAARTAEVPPEGTRVVTDADRQRDLWEVRESALGATAHPPGRRLTWPGWDDAAVAPERLGDYLADFQQLLEKYGYAEDSSIYGHFGHGCIHVSIPFDLTTAPGISAFRSFVERCADLVVSYGGSLSGEHGDGVARGELLGRMFGPELMRAMRELKTLLDPDGLLNPGKVVDPLPLDARLRLGTDFAPDPGPTAFGYPDDDGSFTRAVLRCVGVGKCRREGVGEGDGHVMCPSYRATGQEEHSTRGRARLLFEMLRRDVVTDGWRSEAVRDALDLCLACKGCKSDCPVGTDMATYKAEFLHHHYARRPRPLAHYSMGWLPVLAAAARRAPRLVNALTRMPLLDRAVKAAGGVAPERDLPLFARQTFQAWFADRTPAGDGRHGEVLLWPDTFTNHFHPHVARA
ncbi:MAG TPA: FAD-linked oxidase C-terminal domain-containing protein, partial [Motilibacteraceae bacterium]|nr:FAD-linked oxidase C-terminal domain-containing protein [Motilibacteraceae bacterium]